MLKIEHIRQKLKEIVKSQSTLQKLLLSEKRKRNLNTEDLVFVSTSIIASYWWCPVKAYILSKLNELEHFKLYLYDIAMYSYELGYIRSIPENVERILNIGNNLTLEDMEKILERRIKLSKEKTVLWFENGCNITIIEDKLAIIQYGNLKLGYINPLLAPSIKKSLENKIKELNAVAVDFNTLPSKVRGKILEVMIKEKYPTIRWYFKWRKYVVTAEPDGLTKDFVYEFKTTRNVETLGGILKIAETQADIYGFFFRRSRKRVQVYILEAEKLITMDSKVDENNAKETLKRFLEVERTKKPKSKELWKCRVCEVKHICSSITAE